MKSSFLSFLVVFLLSAHLSAESVTTCQIAKDAIKEASLLRGLAVRSRVPCEVHDKGMVEKFLRQTIETKLPRDKLKYEEILYKAIGLIREDFNYKEGMLSLYLGQLGGYYDPEKKHFIMAGWIPQSMQHIVAVHELTHALQDQHYDLGAIVDPKLENGDMALARSALVEGDATAVMTDYTMGLVGQPKLTKTPNIEGILLQQVLGSGIMSGLDGIPEPLKNMLLFPYTSGLRFVHTLLSHGGYKNVDRAFQKLPKSSEEILHPEKYLSVRPDFIEILPEKGDLYHDTIGEFMITSLVGSVLGNRVAAVEVGAGWGGDLASVRSDNSVKWVTHWDSERDADEFSESYKKVLVKLGKKELSFAREGLNVTIVVPIR